MFTECWGPWWVFRVLCVELAKVHKRWVGTSFGGDNMRRGMATDPSNFIGDQFRASLKGGAMNHFEAMATPVENGPFTTCKD